jgi:hypothetical protein
MVDCHRPGGRLVRQRLDRHCASETGHAIHNSLLKKGLLIQQYIEITLNISDNYIFIKEYNINY